MDEAVNDEAAVDYVFDFRDSDVIVVDVMGAKIGRTVVPVLYRHEGTRTSIEGSAFCIASSPDSPEALYVTQTRSRTTSAASTGYRAIHTDPG